MAISRPRAQALVRAEKCTIAMAKVPKGCLLDPSRPPSPPSGHGGRGTDAHAPAVRPTRCSCFTNIGPARSLYYPGGPHRLIISGRPPALSNGVAGTTYRSFGRFPTSALKTDGPIGPTGSNYL